MEGPCMPMGATRSMTVDELDAAFDRSAREIGLTTLVQRPKGGEWRTLGEAAGVDDSIRPVSSDFELVDIPRPPPLPKRLTATSARRATPSPRTSSLRSPPAESGPPPRRGRDDRSLVGGVVAWRYMPAKPIGTLDDHHLAPHTPAAAAQPPPRSCSRRPRRRPRPEGNALAEQTIVGALPNASAANALKGVKPVKATGGAKSKTKTTWKQRIKLHAKTKKNARSAHAADADADDAPLTPDAAGAAHRHPPDSLGPRTSVVPFCARPALGRGGSWRAVSSSPRPRPPLT